MKHFDNSNSVMEPENHSKNMANLKNLMSSRKFLFLIVAIFVFNSCAKLHYIKQTPKRDDISMSPDLRQFLNKNKTQQLSVVLRTPRTTSNITQEVQSTELYNAIERKLMNAGFVIRDRALLEKLLVNEQSSYEDIAQKVKADLIIEVMENSKQNHTPNTMFRKKNDKRIDIRTRDQLNIITFRFTFRIVIVETGASSGIFTFHYFPCANGCDTYAAKYMGYHFFGNTKKEVNRRVWLNTRPLNYNWWWEDDYIINDLSNKIINILQER